MGIKLKTEEGAEFSFDTVAEFMEFKKQIDAEEASKETESTTDEGSAEDEIENQEPEPEIEVGDKVRIVSSEDGTDLPYHYHDVGSVGKVVSIQRYGRIEVEIDYETQYLLPHHYVKVESLGKDANGEDLYEGDYVTGTEDNGYGNTNDRVVIEVLGAGESHFFEEANINVSIVGYSARYNVESSKFIKLSDNLDEARTKFKEIKGDGRVLRCGVEEQEFRTGDVVRVTEDFEDHFGDRVSRGEVYDYDENFGLGEPFVGTVFLGDNKDKIELVCRAEDRLDK